MAFSISVDYATPTGVIATQIGDALSSIGLGSIAKIDNSASIVTSYSFGVPDFSFDFFPIDFGANYQGWTSSIFSASAGISDDAISPLGITATLNLDTVQSVWVGSIAQIDIFSKTATTYSFGAPDFSADFPAIDFGANYQGWTSSILGMNSGIAIDPYVFLFSSALIRRDITAPLAFDVTATPIAWTVPIPISWGGSLIKDEVLPVGFIAFVLRDLSSPLVRSGTFATDTSANLIAGSSLTRDLQIPLLWTSQTYVVSLDSLIPLRTGATVSDDVSNQFTAGSSILSDRFLGLGSSATAAVHAPSAMAVTSSVGSDALARFKTSAAIGSDQPIGVQTVAAFIREVPLVVQWQTMLFPVVGDDAIPLLIGATAAGDFSIPVIWEAPPWFRHEWYSRTVAPSNTYITYVEGLPVRIIIR